MTSSFQGTAAGTIVVGNNTTEHSQFALTNNWGSSVDVYIRRLTVQNDSFATLVSYPMPIMRTYRIPSEVIVGGVTLNKSSFDTNYSSSEFVEARCNTQFTSVTTPADFTFVYPAELSSITGSSFLWQQYTTKLSSLIGQVLGTDNNILPQLVETSSFILHPGEALLVELDAASTVVNASNLTNAWVQVMWEEFPASSSVLYSVSGITKDSASAALGSCDVYLMRKLENGGVEYVTKSISDSVTGEYSFLANSRISTYFVIARKEGTPNVFDVTDFTLTPVNT